MAADEGLAELRDELAVILHQKSCEYLQDYSVFIPFAAYADQSHISGVSDELYMEEMDDKERIKYLIDLIDQIASENGCIAAAVCFQTQGFREGSDEVVDAVTVLAYSIDGETDVYRAGNRNAGNNPEFDPLTKMASIAGIAWDLPLVQSWARHAEPE